MDASLSAADSDDHAASKNPRAGAAHPLPAHVRAIYVFLRHPACVALLPHGCAMDRPGDLGRPDNPALLYCGHARAELDGAFGDDLVERGHPLDGRQALAMAASVDLLQRDVRGRPL